MSQPLWTIDDVANHLSIPKNTLYRWSSNGSGPIARRLGKHLRYRPEDVDAWVADQGSA